MKRIIFIGVVTFVFVFTVYANGQNEISVSNTTDFDDKGILILYFSEMESGLDTLSSASRVLSNGELYGNTEYIAGLIQKKVGGDLVRIETVDAYPDTHQALLNAARREIGSPSYPEIKTKLDNLSSYDVVFLGYPIWNADLPYAVYSFMNDVDFSGKTIILFSTHGGSRLSGTVNTITRLAPGANVITDALSISRTDVAKASTEREVNAWLESLHL